MASALIKSKLEEVISIEMDESKQYFVTPDEISAAQFKGGLAQIF